MNETSEFAGTYAVVSGMSAVPCLLVEGSGRVLQELFGREFVADAVAYFKADVVLLPHAASSSGKSDKVVITEKNGRVTTWLVVGFRSNANKNRGSTAALTKWSS